MNLLSANQSWITTDNDMLIHSESDNRELRIYFRRAQPKEWQPCFTSDFLNCLFVVQSELSAGQLKAEFVTMELAHGRDRGNPLCKVTDRSLDIDILASHERDAFAGVGVDAYLRDLLAEMYEGGRVGAHKVALPPTR